MSQRTIVFVGCGIPATLIAACAIRAAPLDICWQHCVHLAHSVPKRLQPYQIVIPRAYRPLVDRRVDAKGNDRHARTHKGCGHAHAPSGRDEHVGTLQPLELLRQLPLVRSAAAPSGPALALRLPPLAAQVSAKSDHDALQQLLDAGPCSKGQRP